MFLSAGIGFLVFLLFPVGLGFASQITDEERVGGSVGLVFGCSMAVGSFAPMLVGYLIDELGFHHAFLSMAGVAVAGAILAYFLPDRS